MFETVDAVIDLQGRVILKGHLKPGRIRRAIVTILDEQSKNDGPSTVGSVEIIDGDLDEASLEITNSINASLDNTESQI